MAPAADRWMSPRRFRVQFACKSARAIQVVLVAAAFGAWCWKSSVHEAQLFAGVSTALDSPGTMTGRKICDRQQRRWPRLQEGGTQLGISRLAQADDEAVLAEARAALEGAKRGLDAMKAAEEESGPLGVPEPEPTELPGADGSLGPAVALVNSRKVRRAASVLLSLARGPNGNDALVALANRACSALEAGDDASTTTIIAEADWNVAGVPLEEAAAALDDFRDLLDPTSGLPLSEDRVAMLLAMEFDLMPDNCRKYFGILDLADPEMQPSDDAIQLNFLDPESEKLKKEAMTTPGVIDATRFAKRLELIASEEGRLQARWDRLQSKPLVRDMRQAASEDVNLQELTAAIEPFRLRLYNATRTAQRRALKKKKGSASEDTDDAGTMEITLELDLVQIIGGILVLGALIYFVIQGLPRSGSNFSPASTANMPVYSLSNSPPPGK